MISGGRPSSHCSSLNSNWSGSCGIGLNSSSDCAASNDGGVDGVDAGGCAASCDAWRPVCGLSLCCGFDVGFGHGCAYGFGRGS